MKEVAKVRKTKTNCLTLSNFQFANYYSMKCMPHLKGYNSPSKHEQNFSYIKYSH